MAFVQRTISLSLLILTLTSCSALGSAASVLGAVTNSTGGDPLLSVDAQIGDESESIVTAVDAQINTTSDSVVVDTAETVNTNRVDAQYENIEDLTVKNNSGIGNLSLLIIITALLGPFLLGWVTPNPKKSWFQRKDPNIIE